jgi:hypothetical protein
VVSARVQIGTSTLTDSRSVWERGVGPAPIAEDGRTIGRKGELSKDGATWERDLELTYTLLSLLDNHPSLGIHVHAVHVLVLA